MDHNAALSEAPKLLSVEDVAVVFRCNPETVKRQARAGKLPGFKFGKSWLFNLQSINEMVNARFEASCGVNA